MNTGRSRTLAATAAAVLAAVAPLLGARHVGAAGTTYYISPSGSDANTGLTLAAPFRTIQQCATVAVAGDTCSIRAGIYHETVVPAHSGTAGNPISFAPYSGEAVTVSGADSVSGWTVTTTASVAAVLNGSEFAGAVAAGHVYQTNVTLPPAPWSNPPPQAPNPPRGLGVPPNDQLFAEQVFVDGRMMLEARYPHSNLNPLTPTRLIAGPNTTPHTIDAPWLVQHQDSQTNNFWNVGTVQLAAGYGNFNDTAPIITNESTGSGQIIINSPYATKPGYAEECTQACTKPGDPYFLFGKLGSLGAPGEWFYDSTAHELYLWSPDGASPTTHTVEAKQRNYAFDLSGLSYVNVSGLGIFSATVLTTSTSQHNTLDGLTVTYSSHFMTVPTYYDPSPWGMYDLAQYQLNTGIILDGSGNTLKNSVITFSAGNGVSLTGDGNTVTNNVISEVAYNGQFTAGVFIGSDQSPGQGTGTTSNHQITHNTVFDTGFGAGILEMNSTDTAKAFTNIHISYNDVFNTGILTSDGGPIYICCDFSTGTTVDHNWVHDAESKTDRYNTGAYTNAGIYFDISAGNGIINRNVSWNNAGDGLRLNGSGSNNQQNQLVYNNTLGRGQVDSVGSAFSPNMAGTQFINNIFAMDGNTFGVNVQTSANNYPSSPDPAFVSPATGDYHLTAGSPAIDYGQVIPGYTTGYVGTAPDAGAYEYGGADFTPGCTLTACAVARVDDSTVGAGANAFTYTGAGWTHCTTCPQVVFPYQGTLSTSAAVGDAATMSFSGTAVVLHTQTGPGNGIAGVSIDGGAETRVDTWAPQPGTGPNTTGPRPPSTGDQVVWRSPQLSAGTHTLKVRVTGSANPASTGAAVGLDRVDVLQVPIAGLAAGGVTTSDLAPPSVTGAGTTVFTDPTGDATGDPVGSFLACGSTACQQPDFDLTSGSLQIGGGQLKVKLAVVNAAPFVPNLAANPYGEWREHRMQWTSGLVTYFAAVVQGYFLSAANSATVYEDGILAPDGSEIVLHGADTGSITTGASGVYEIDVPLGNVNISSTAGTLVKPQAAAIDWHGNYTFSFVPGTQPPVNNPTLQLGYTVDTGGPSLDYTWVTP